MVEQAEEIRWPAAGGGGGGAADEEGDNWEQEEGNWQLLERCRTDDADDQRRSLCSSPPHYRCWSSFFVVGRKSGGRRVLDLDQTRAIIDWENLGAEKGYW